METKEPSNQHNRAAPDHKGNKLFQCKECGKVFGRACNLVQHMWIHTAEKPFKCQYCDCSFNSVANMKKHNRKKHADITNNTKIEVSLGVLETPRDETLKIEVAEEFPECEVEEKAVDESTKSVVENLAWVCDKCGRKFLSKSRLMTHMRFHEGKQIFSCIYCEKDFLSRDQRKMHERIHTGEKPYKCDHCPKFFYILSKLYAHTRSAHKDASADTQTKWQSFLCYVCKEEFNTKRALIEHHASQHKKERYQCKFCQQKFIYKSLLRTHERTHYSKSDKVEFARLEQSNKKSYSCEYCGVDFPNKTDLQLHQLTHFSDLKYCCRYCKMNFLNENTLILHERSHTGEQPYKCDYCGRWFSLLGTLYGHIRTQHPHAELPDKSRFENVGKRQADQSPKPPAETFSEPTSEAFPQATGTSPSKKVQTVSQPTTRQSSPRFAKLPSPTKLIQAYSQPTTKKSSPRSTKLSSPKNLMEPFSQPTTKESSSRSSKLPSPPTPKSSSQTTPKASLQQNVKSLPKSLSNNSPGIKLSPCKSTKSLSKVPSQPTSNLSLQSSAKPISKQTFDNVSGSPTGEMTDKPYKCEYCDRGFKKTHHLKEHRYLHIGKPHECIVCGQTFTRRNRLESHMLSHTENDRFECDICRYKFPTSKKLVTHRSINHNGNAQDNEGYKCQSCDITFAYKHNLEKHLKSHADEVVELTLPSKAGSISSDGAQKELTCKECGTVVRLGRTTLSNVFSVTDFSSVKCLLNNHTMI